MAKDSRKNSDKNQTTEAFKELLDYGWDITLSIYILSILVILPFYFEEGYAHIGTDKAMFFSGTILRLSWVLLPLLVLTLIWKGYMCLHIYRNSTPKALLLKCKAYCRQEFSLTDICAAAYGLCAVLSYCCSRYKEEALWGTPGWYMGLIPQLTVVMAYFLISRCWKGHKWILLTVLPVSAAVFLLGYINRFGIYPIEMAYAGPTFISTIGNINWYCGYVVTVLFGGVCLLWLTAGTQKRPLLTGLLMIYVTLGFATLITQGSASGLLGWMAVLGTAYLLSIPDGKKMQNWWLLMVLFGAAGSCTYLLTQSGLVSLNYNEIEAQLLTGNVWIIVMTLVSFGIWAAVKYSAHKGKYQPGHFKVLGKLVLSITLILLGIYLVIAIVNTATDGKLLEMTPLSGNSLFLFDTSWGSIRGATLAAGVKCWQEQDLLHKLFGVGPDCMSVYLYADSSESLLAMVQESFPTRRLTNAHNEWLTLLVNTGLLGMLSFAGMMVSAIWRYLGVNRRGAGQRNGAPKAGLHSTIAMACGFCLLAYTFNNMVSFQQPMNLATLSVVLGVGEYYCRQSAAGRSS